MSTAALFLTLVSALLHASRDLLIKRSDDKIAFSWLFRVVGIALITPIALFRFDTNIPGRAWMLIAASSVVHVLYALSLARAYEQGDLSLVYPIARSAPIFVLLWATLIWREAMSPLGIIGVVVIVFGAYVLQVRGFSKRRSATSTQGIFHDRSLKYAWLTALLVAAYSLIDDRAVSLIDPAVFLLLYGSLTCAILTPILLATRRSSVEREWRLRWPLILVAAAASTGSYLLALFALQLDQVSYVAGVRQVSILFGVILGWRVLKEPHGRSRLVGAVIMVFGILMIGLSS